VNGVLIASIYLPNGNPQPGPKFDYKLAWFSRLAAHAAELMEAGVPVVLAGDYNVVPTEADIWPGHHEQANALLQPGSRAAYQGLLDQGWTDALRTLQPEGPLWTFWGYLRHRWPNDKGMRLDHLLLSPALAANLRGAGVDRDVRGQEGASDHAPTWVAQDGLRPDPRSGGGPRAGQADRGHDQISGDTRRAIFCRSGTSMADGQSRPFARRATVARRPTDVSPPQCSISPPDWRRLGGGYGSCGGRPGQASARRTRAGLVDRWSAGP
jgi:hypothetical protein